MTYVHDADLEFLRGLEGFDPSFEIIHFDDWADFEESSWLAIARKDGQLYEVDGGHSVYAEPGHKDIFDPSPISEERALARMLEWEQNRD